MNNEKILRKIIRKKLSKIFIEQKHKEMALRGIIRKILNEGDLSDIHPHRSTGINALEDVLKKSIPTLRVDYKRLTTDKSQRDSFRAHIVNAIKDSVAPERVNSSYGIDDTGGGMMLAEPEAEESDDDLDDELKELEEADIQVDIEDDEPEADDNKKIPVEDDDEPSPEESFGAGLEGFDETGRNMAYTSYRKISQYILDAYDSLANPEDKETFYDYLITNMKLYFDKFEAELSNKVEEPTTAQYDQAKEAS